MSSNLGLSAETQLRIDLLFSPDQRDQVANLLATKCGNNLPFLETRNVNDLERFQFAALKLSNGTIQGLQNAIDLANLDWRDLLMSAGFGHDINAHVS